MQVGNIYVDLEIPDLKLKEFLQVTDCYAIEIVETAGTSLPTALMVIKSDNEKVINGINENTYVIIKIGNSATDCDSYNVYPQIIEPYRNSEDDTWIIEFGGFIGERNYMVNQMSEAYHGTSLDVLKNIFPKEKFITNIESTKENEVDWRVVNETYCQFAIDTVLHMDIRPSFPLVGIDKYNNFYLRDFEQLCKDPIKAYFVPYTPPKNNCYQYINNFNIKTYKAAYDLFAGFNRITQVLNSSSGTKNNVVSPNTPVIASSQVSEKTEAGINQTLNNIQSDNVHKTFTEAYIYNTNKLVSMSSIVGEVLVPGYFRDIAPTDMVYVVDNGRVGQVLTGRYIVDTISTVVNFSTGEVLTKFYVTRDNKNNVEDYILKKKGIKITSKLMQQLANAISELRVAYAFCKEIMDGTYLNRLLSWGLETKTNLLRMFSVAGVNIDFNSQAELIRSLVLVGNSLMNSLVDMVFPANIASVLHDFIINKPKLIGIIGSYVSQYVPVELQSVIMKLFESLFQVSDTLNSISKDNGILVTTSPAISTTENIFREEPMPQEVIEGTGYTDENQERVNDIISKFEEKTRGVDIPFPRVVLDESQSLYSEEELVNYLANKTIENLTNLGYIANAEEAADLKDLLVSEDPNEVIDYALVSLINANAGKAYSYRYWGTFGSTNEALYAWSYEDDTVYTKTEEIRYNTRLYKSDASVYTGQDFKVEEKDNKYIVAFDGEETVRNEDEDVITNALAELTSFMIKKSYKDFYRTVPCTKIINATNNQRIYFACPKREGELIFYINSKRVILPSFEIDLGDVDALGNIIMYNVFYTNTGYNSNSVLFEVKKGGI